MQERNGRVAPALAIMGIVGILRESSDELPSEGPAKKEDDEREEGTEEDDEEEEDGDGDGGV